MKKIKLIAPASSLSKAELELSLNLANSLKLKLDIPKNLLTKHPFYANKLEIQLEHLCSALNDDEIDIIWCARGGWGSLRLLPHLAKIKKPKKNKLLIGYSDITFLHLFFNQVWNWPTLHANNFSGLPQMTSPQIRHLLDIIDNNKVTKSQKLTPLNQAAQNIKKIDAKLIGGNLRIIQSSLATPWQVDARNKIIFFEDVAERGYSIDRMLVQLEIASVFKQVKAIIFGDFTLGIEKNNKDYTAFALKEFAQRTNVPVFKGLKVGHGKFNTPLLLNHSYRLEKNVLSMLA
jgi:muramoyltetrapeptide carboxypeptidase